MRPCEALVYMIMIELEAITIYDCEAKTKLKGNITSPVVGLDKCNVSSITITVRVACETPEMVVQCLYLYKTMLVLGTV